MRSTFNEGRVVATPWLHIPCSKEQRSSGEEVFRETDLERPEGQHWVRVKYAITPQRGVVTRGSKMRWCYGKLYLELDGAS